MEIHPPNSRLRSPSPGLWNSLSLKLALGRIQTTTPIGARAETREPDLCRGAEVQPLVETDGLSAVHVEQVSFSERL